MIKTFFDHNRTRYQLYKTIPGKKQHDWLFVPGGPGMDSSYLIELVEALNLPGNYWLVDFPENGSNRQGLNSDEKLFESWRDCFIDAVKQFDHPILVGHSFSAMVPLFMPELENLLSAAVLICSSPKHWKEESAKAILKVGLKLSDQSRRAFMEHPSEEMFKKMIAENVQLYFLPGYFEKGQELYERAPFNYKAVIWWVNKAAQSYEVTWIPQALPTLIIGGSNDYLLPLSLFQNDHRFQRSNIIFHEIKNAGHFPWVEQEAAVCAAIETSLSCYA